MLDPNEEKALLFQNFYKIEQVMMEITTIYFTEMIKKLKKELLDKSFWGQLRYAYLLHHKP